MSPLKLVFLTPVKALLSPLLETPEGMGNHMDSRTQENIDQPIGQTFLQTAFEAVEADGEDLQFYPQQKDLYNKEAPSGASLEAEWKKLVMP